MTPRQRELEEIRLKAAKMWVKKKIEKESNYCQILVGKNMLKVLTGEA